MNTTMTLGVPRGEALERVRAAADHRLGEIGLRLVEQRRDALTYGPAVCWPLVLWLWRRLAGENVILAFSDDGAMTRVSVSGRLPDQACAEVEELVRLVGA